MMLLIIGDEDCFVVEDVLMMIVTVRVSFIPCRRTLLDWSSFFLFSTLALWIFPIYGAAPFSDLIPKGILSA